MASRRSASAELYAEVIPRQIKLAHELVRSEPGIVAGTHAAEVNVADRETEISREDAVKETGGVACTVKIKTQACVPIKEGLFVTQRQREHAVSAFERHQPVIRIVGQAKCDAVEIKCRQVGRVAEIALVIEIDVWEQEAVREPCYGRACDRSSRKMEGESAILNIPIKGTAPRWSPGELS